MFPLLLLVWIQDNINYAAKCIACNLLHSLNRHLCIFFFMQMSPIIGERYKCKDCVESIGFDLCEACHNNPAKVPGRFNQQHKPEHKFEIMQPTSLSDLINRINSDMSDDEGSDATEIRDGVARTGDLSGDVPEDPENDTNDLEDASSCFLPVDASLDPQDDSDERSSDFPR